MAQQMLDHNGNVSGYQAAGDEVRADAKAPHAASLATGGPQIRAYTLPAPLGNPSKDGQQREQPEPPEDEPAAEDDSWHYSADVPMDEPSYAGAIQGRGGPLADQISGTAPKAIESAAPKAIAGAVEDVL